MLTNYLHPSRSHSLLLPQPLAQAAVEQGQARQRLRTAVDGRREVVVSGRWWVGWVRVSWLSRSARKAKLKRTWVISAGVTSGGDGEAVLASCLRLTICFGAIIAVSLMYPISYIISSYLIPQLASSCLTSRLLYPGYSASSFNLLLIELQVLVEPFDRGFEHPLPPSFDLRVILRTRISILLTPTMTHKGRTRLPRTAKPCVHPSQ